MPRKSGAFGGAYRFAKLGLFNIFFKNTRQKLLNSVKYIVTGGRDRPRKKAQTRKDE